MSEPWSVDQRRQALLDLARDGVELLVIGGGITGAGIVRDAALRGLKTALIERGDFAAGTSSHTSKMVHGGLRYIAEGALGVTRESCRERDLLARLNPLLVRPLPFLFCSFADGIAPWKMLAGLSIYAGLAGFRGGGFRLLSHAEVQGLSRDLRHQGLRAAGFYRDQQVDDARLVLETLKDARRAGAEAISYCEALRLERDNTGITRVAVRDLLGATELVLRATHVINATGAWVDRLRERPLAAYETRPAKGVHLTIARERVHAEAAVSFQAADGRNLFLCPYDDVHLLGTTDTFSEELDEPQVSASDAAYVLAAANRAFPRAQLGLRDIVSAYAGVRPLVAARDAPVPPSSVSREHHISEDPSGLLSIAGGKLTTYRRMAEQIVDRVVKRLPGPRQRQLRPCRTRERPLRDDQFDVAALGEELAHRFALPPGIVGRLLSRYGAQALEMVERAPSAERKIVANGRFMLCEVAFSFTHECAVNLSDVLERRVRAAVFSIGQGLPELSDCARVAARVRCVSAACLAEEQQAYRERVDARYRVTPT